jgi:hypothetical protein
LEQYDHLKHFLLNIYFPWALHTIPLEIEIKKSTASDLFLRVSRNYKIYHLLLVSSGFCLRKKITRKRRVWWGNLTFSPCPAKINITLPARLLVICRYWIPSGANIVSKKIWCY